MRTAADNRAPELWMPADVRERATELRKRLRKRVSPLASEHANWRTIASTRIGQHVEAHSADSCTADRSPSAENGSPPALGSMGTWREIPQNGTPMPNEFFVARPPVAAEPPEAQMIVQSILNSPDRLWNAYITFLAIDAAVAEREEHKRVEAEAEFVKRVLACPICGSVPDSSGQTIRPRALIQGSGMGHVPSMRSCPKCWAVAAARYIDKLASEQTSDGRTRAQAVTKTVA